jgi:predicted nucleic-acid-binding protein
MRAVDTNVLVRLIVGDDDDQIRVGETFLQAGAWVSSLALAETAWVLADVYSFNPARLASAIQTLLSRSKLVFQDEDAAAAALALFRHHPKLSFTDCLLLELARKAGHLPLGTFDRALGRVDGAQRL